MKSIAVLEVHSFGDVDPFACHYYGAIHYEDGSRQDVNRILTEQTAHQLNEAEGRALGNHYIAGMKTSRFVGRYELEETAIMIYKDHYPKPQALLRGFTACSGPQYTLDGTEHFIKKGRELYKRAEANLWWEGDRKIMDRISKEWDKLVSCL